MVSVSSWPQEGHLIADRNSTVWFDELVMCGAANLMVDEITYQLAVLRMVIDTNR